VEKTMIDLQIKNRSAIDPDQVFNRDHARDENFQIADRFTNKKRDPILKEKSQVGCEKLNGSVSSRCRVLRRRRDQAGRFSTAIRFAK
jgi:hypothetical protein